MKLSGAQSAQLRLSKLLLANDFRVEMQPLTEVLHARWAIDAWFASEPDSTTILFCASYREKGPSPSGQSKTLNGHLESHSHSLLSSWGRYFSGMDTAQKKKNRLYPLGPLT